MQIDFHHAVTYVVARCAGFDHDSAAKVAHAAQYVDDATEDTPILFDNGATMSRVVSSHAMLDPTNAVNYINHRVWLPFHFLPGNGGLEAGKNPSGTFINKIVCVRDSPVAWEMNESMLANKNKPFGLHLLGVTMHVYADTFAHFGFAGVRHDINDVEKARDLEEDGSTLKGLLKGIWGNVVDSAIPPIGHGQATTLPDMPFLKWEYTNAAGNPIMRDNTKSFVMAADAMCRVMQRYRGVQPTGLPMADRARIQENFHTFHDHDGDKRHQEWIDSIRQGDFSFGSATIRYIIGDEEGSWKKKALGTSVTQLSHPYSPDFLHSDWKHFHDALHFHRYKVLHEILPRYGIMAA